MSKTSEARRAYMKEYLREYHARHREKYLEYGRAYRAKNPEKERLRHKKYNAENSEKTQAYRTQNREKIKLRSKEYYEKNRESINQKSRAYRVANQAKLQQYSKEYNAENREKIHLRNQEYYAKNGDKLRQNQREYSRENKDKCQENLKRFHANNPGYRKAYNAEYYAKTKQTEALRSNKREYMKKRRVHDSNFALMLSLRRRLLLALAGKNKSGATEELVGGVENAKRHLESKFRDGMTWANRGELWQIDHVRPVSSFDLNDPVEQRQCFHYSNLQPLLILENLKKSASY
jgi:hypothetical protein